MSATEELRRLAARKTSLEARIAIRRARCALAIDELRGPASLVDRATSLWRSVPEEAKWAAVPAAVFVGKQLAKRFGGPLAWLGYVPAAVQVARTLAEARKGSHRPARA